MFGSGDSRPSYIKKPAAGISRLYPNAAASSRIPAAGSKAVGAQQPSYPRKKTSEELFKEHKEAAIAWAAKRNLNVSHGELPTPDPAPAPAVRHVPVSTVPSPPSQPVSRSREQLPAQSPIAFSISPPKHQSLTSPPIRKYTERKPSPDPVVPLRDTIAISAPVLSERSRLPSPLASPVGAPIKVEVDYGPFSPARAASQSSQIRLTTQAPQAFSPQLAVPSKKPKESIFARFKKESEAEETDISLVGSVNAAKVSSPMDKTDNTNADAVLTQPAVAAVKKALYERVLDLTGVSALKQHERTFLAGLLATSPVLIYLLEVTAHKYILPSDVSGEGLYGLCRHVHAEFNTMTPIDLGISAVLAVLLSAVFDRNTRATDARIRHDWAAAAAFVASIRAQFLKLVGQDSVVDNVNTEQGTSKDVAHASKQRGVLTNVKAVLSVFGRIPVFVRFVVTILLFGAVSRVVLGRVVEAVGVTAAQYGPVLLVAAALVVCAMLGFVYVRYALHRRAARSRAVKVLASVVKALLQQRGRAYPILYLYEEVAEVVSLSTSQRGVMPLFSPTSTPAVVHSTPSSGYVGDAQRPAQTQPEPLLFGSPLGLSASSKENLLRASVAEAGGSSAGTGSGTDASADAVALKKEVLEGHKLPHLWKEVLKVVEADRRVQRLELIVDGKKHACWRLLTGNTQANI